MEQQFRQLEKDVDAARGDDGPPFVVNIEKQHNMTVGPRGRPTRSCRRDYAPPPREEGSEGSCESDDEESDLDTPLT